MFNVPLVCSGSADPACANMSGTEAVAWALTGFNPSCTGVQQLSFASPRRRTGSWSVTCPVNPQAQGRIEEVSWSLDGS